MSTRVLSNLPPLAKPALPAVQLHRVEAPKHALHVMEWPAPEDARFSVMMLPGAGGHVAAYAGLASELRARGLHVFGVDPPGHGRSAGPRGGVTMGPMTEDLAFAAQWITQRAPRPLCLLGISLGAEWALHTHLSSSHVRATVCHTLLLPTLVPLDARIRVLRSRVMKRVTSLFPHVPIPLTAVVDAQRVYLDSSTRAERAADPLMLKSYQLNAWRSFFTTQPHWPPSSNHKPVLVVVGERDEVLTPAHALRCFMALGGPKAFHVIPGAAHHLALENAPQLADATADFLGNLPP